LSTEGTYHVGFETVNALILLDVKFVTKLTLCATDRGVPAPQLRSRPVPSPQPVPQPPALAGPGCNRSLLRGLPARAAGVVRCATGGRPAPGGLPSRHALACGGGWRARPVGTRARCEETPARGVA